MEDKPIQRITGQNRRAWNEIAEERSKIFPPASFFAAGGSTLAERDVSAVRSIYGDLSGLRLIHLQCATGEDTLSWAVLGASPDGVDISDEQIEIARAKAAEAGLPVRFAASDVYSLPAALPGGWLGVGYDLVFTGGGAIVWLPDLEAWARVVESLLRPGGRLLISDEHPLAGCLTLEEGQLRVVDDYFRRKRGLEGSGWYHFDPGKEAREAKVEFTWPIGDVVTAVAGAGLVIERLEEFPGGPEWQFGTDQGEMARLPGIYQLVAKKA
jgi:SAM-dependent methyltransferase